jgi:hypothetical protein
MNTKQNSPKGELRIAGASLTTGKWEETYFCALHYFSEQKRWAVKSLHTFDRDIISFHPPINSFTVDLPLHAGLCSEHVHALPPKSVQFIQQMLNKQLDEDAIYAKTHPKKYEQERKRDELIDFKKHLLESRPTSSQLSLTYKRKLKKGFIPYLHRPIDAWVWMHYFDAMNEAFKVTFDSYGHVSVPLLQRFAYFRSQFPTTCDFFETNFWILLLELYRADLINKKQLLFERKGEEAIRFRSHIIETLESKLGLFIYDQDLSVLVRQPRAFASFLLAVAGLRRQQGDFYQLPKWALEQSSQFFVPHFMVR